MKTVIYNVGHGDAIFIDLGNEGIIRDFGTLTQAYKKRIESLANFILRYKKRNSNYVFDSILSHPHEDHCSGYHYLHQNLGARKIFRNTFIPWLDFSKDKTIHGFFLKIGLMYLYFISSSSPIGKRIREWITMAPLMADLSTHLYGVSEGCYVGGRHCCGRILWPPQKQPIASMSTLLYHNFCIDGFINMDDDPVSHFEKQLDENVRKNFRELYEELRTALNAINTDGAQENGENNYDNIDAILKKMPTNSIGSLNSQSQFSLEHVCQNVMLKNIDNHSIVLEIEDYALFLSDLNSNCINKVASHHLTGKMFKLLKSAHHGSKFGKKLRTVGCKADKIIHCCGLSNSNYNGPSSLYCDILSSQNPQTSANDVVCTDWVQTSSKWVMPISGYNILSLHNKRKIIF